MGDFTMPSLGADMTQGTLVEWLVAPGDTVAKGDVVAVVDTDKSAIEVECFEAGTVTRLLVEPGTTLPVGAPLAVIDVAGDGADAAGPREPGTVEVGRGVEPAPNTAEAESTARPGKPEAPGPSTPPLTVEPVADPATAVRLPAARPDLTGAPGGSPLVRRLAERLHVDLHTVPGTGRGGRVTRADVERAATGARRIRATPYARRLAGELGVDLASVTGTGTDGAVRGADVRRAATRGGDGARPVADGPASGEPTAAARAEGAPGDKAAEKAGDKAAEKSLAMRRAIAGLMSRSKREVPHYYLSTTVDLTAALDWMTAYNRRVPVTQRLVPAALLLKAAALAAREVPAVNGFWLDDRFVPATQVHLGTAIALRGGGLIAPALHDADRLTLPALMAALKDLVARARAGRLRGSETADPTITVTSLGDQGVEAVFGVIYPPQVAVVGFGKVVHRPLAVDGMLGVRPCVTATLSADHRASDGAVGARYLAAVDRLLQNPEEL